MRVALLLLIILPSLVHAQDGRPIGCRFLSLGGVKSPRSVVSRSDKEEEVQCPLPSGSLSDRINCFAKGNRIDFFSAGAAQRTATATIPAGTKNAILIFLDNPAHGPGKPATVLPWHVMVIEDSKQGFPEGGTFVANLCSTEVRFVLGEHKGLLKGGSSKTYAIPEERDSFNMARVIFQFSSKGKWRIANESALRFLPQTRYLMFAYVADGSSRPRVKTISDISTASP